MIAGYRRCHWSPPPMTRCLVMLCARVDMSMIGQRGAWSDQCAAGPPTRGIGHALMHSVLGAADATDEPLVCVLGDPTFYQRFGFRVASDVGILAPDPGWASDFQARILSSCPPGLTGTFRYASPFGELDLG
jgi:hypothetical protein